MTTVTKEYLAARIEYMDWRLSVGDVLSLNEEYQLEAYRMLLDCLRNEEADRQMQDEFYQGRL